jgi:hypothetical protein
VAPTDGCVSRKGGGLLQRAMLEEEGIFSPKWLVASVRIRELGRKEIF